MNAIEMDLYDPIVVYDEEEWEALFEEDDDGN